MISDVEQVLEKYIAKRLPKRWDVGWDRNHELCFDYKDETYLWLSVAGTNACLDYATMCTMSVSGHRMSPRLGRRAPGPRINLADPTSLDQLMVAILAVCKNWTSALNGKR